jgi:hypothetical protein
VSGQGSIGLPERLRIDSSVLLPLMSRCLFSLLSAGWSGGGHEVTKQGRIGDNPLKALGRKEEIER